MSLDFYKNELRKYPVLDNIHEKEIALKAKQGDKKSIDILVKSNLRFVIHIAKKYSSDNNIDDLVQQGSIGLLEAATRYNPEQNNRFITFAAYYVKKEIFNYLDESKGIKIPEKEKQLKRSIDNSIEKNPKRFKQSLELLAKDINQYGPINYTENELSELLKKVHDINFISLNSPLYGDTLGELGDLISRDNHDDLENEALNKVNFEYVMNIISKEISELNIDNKIKYILQKKICDNLSYEDIAESLGVKKERVMQNYFKGLRFITSKLLCREDIKEYFEHLKILS